MTRTQNLGGLFTVIAAVLLGFGGLRAGADGDAGKKELEKLQGTWEQVASETNGEETSDKVIQWLNESVTISKDQFKQRFSRGAGALDVVEETGIIKLDPAADPKAIDFVYYTGKLGGKTRQGIYQVDGDTLRICWLPPEKEGRPTQFKTTKGDGLDVDTFKRKKALNAAGAGPGNRRPTDNPER
jgi:uncharacterized protein (TIGR03067 family)